VRAARFPALASDVTRRVTRHGAANAPRHGAGGGDLEDSGAGADLRCAPPGAAGAPPGGGGGQGGWEILKTRNACAALARVLSGFACF